MRKRAGGGGTGFPLPPLCKLNTYFPAQLPAARCLLPCQLPAARSWAYYLLSSPLPGGGCVAAWIRRRAFLMNPITGLLTALGALTVVFVALWARAVAAARRVMGGQHTPATDARFPTPIQIVLGTVTNFFDALGIGSFATTTAAFKFLKMVPDRIIPGTLNAGHTLPTVTQAFIFIAVIPADVTTLFSMIAAAVLGAWLGAGVIARWPKRKVQIGMGAALLAAAAFFTMRNLSLFPTPEITTSQTVPPKPPAVDLPGDLASRT